MDEATLEQFKQAKKDKIEGLPSEAEFKKQKEVEEAAHQEFLKAVK